MKRFLPFLLAVAVILPASAGRAADVWAEPTGNIYWGDLHIHTEFSIDAVMGRLSEGRFAREAGLYCLYCSKLDFYAVTDHSEMLTRRDYWPEAIDAARNINRIGAGRPDSNGDPAIVAFTGWEWTQSGPYGHKNVIMKWDDPEKLPLSPIRSFRGAPGLYKDEIKKDGRIDLLGGFSLYDIYRGVRYGKKNLDFLAPKPRDLYEKLHEYCLDSKPGCDAVVIPHGNAWGQAPPMYTSWEKQLNEKDHDPELQRLIEVYSKHGNSEEYRDFPPDYRYYRDGKEVSADECSVADNPGLLGSMTGKVSGGFAAPNVEPKMYRKPKSGCEKVCRPPTKSYKPCCWRAGEIVAERCVDPESEFCKERIEQARKTARPFSGYVPPWQKDMIKKEYRDKPGKTEPIDWGMCGQCRDCYQPAFNYITDGSVQKALASAYFDADGNPHYYRFGFISSTDSHKAWGGSVKETRTMVETNTALVAQTSRFNPDTPGWERAVNFLSPGGLVAVISPRRTREDLWNAVKNKHVYGTSGPRIEVWARAQVNHEGHPTVIKMGEEITSGSNPTFYIRANGALEEDDRCPYDDEPEIAEHLTREEFANICLNQCHRVTDKRLKISRIEVVKILQPLTPEEARMEKLERTEDNPEGLIIDPYYTAEEVSGKAVEWSWTDEDFVSEPKGRSVAYYFRLIQEPTPGYDCNPGYTIEQGRECKTDKPDEKALEGKINPQDGSEPVPLASIPDGCYTDLDDPKTYCEERVWTSPFYITRE